MKRLIIVCLAGVSAAFSGSAESVLQPLNEMGYGTVSGRIQSLTMYRDLEERGEGANSTLGMILGYTSPTWAGLDFGGAYNYAGEIYSHDMTELLANDPIHVLNEGWLRFRLESFGLAETGLQGGRKISNGEVFRADDFRQKARSLELVQLETTDIPDGRLTLGHAFRLSDWIGVADRWDFRDFGEVFGTDYDTDGVTWIEGGYGGLTGLDIALFDAYAWDVSNLIGTRVTWSPEERTWGAVGYYRYESDVGDAEESRSAVYGLAWQQTIGKSTLEPGVFSVRGDDLQFQETTTGIHHPLGSSLIIYPAMFAGGADTAYLKSVTKINKTLLYLLYGYTWQSRKDFNGQELDLIVKQQIVDWLSVAFKGGMGVRTLDEGGSSTALDLRLFLTYAY